MQNSRNLNQENQNDENERLILQHESSNVDLTASSSANNIIHPATSNEILSLSISDSSCILYDNGALNVLKPTNNKLNNNQESNLYEINEISNNNLNEKRRILSNQQKARYKSEDYELDSKRKLMLQSFGSDTNSALNYLDATQSHNLSNNSTNSINAAIKNDMSTSKKQNDFTIKNSAIYNSFNSTNVASLASKQKSSLNNTKKVLNSKSTLNSGVSPSGGKKMSMAVANGAGGGDGTTGRAGRSTTYNAQMVDSLSTLSDKKKKVVVKIVTIFSIIFFLICFAMIAFTLRMSEKIDAQCKNYNLFFKIIFFKN
jgi:hypothetical protein